MAELCRRCNQPKEQTKSGSITQWIATCDCELRKSLPEDEDAQQSEPVQMCLACGKRYVSKNRSGSFTQWIFRSDLCNCERPKITLAPNMVPAQPIAPFIPDESDEELPPIDVDPSLFPQERFRPLKLLGKGAAGAVYMCRDNLLQKRVAVKTLHTLSPQQLISFQQEARATSRLSHPNIVRVLDFGISGDSKPYMVMELFAGTTLSDYLSEVGTLDEIAALFLFEKICSTLQYAHDKGVFHRDIKPANLILTGDGTRGFDVQIIDFGIASLDQESQSVQGTTVTGTPNYMSPDQASGAGYDRRSEVYSLGCVLYESLTGRVPFPGDTAMQILSRHANEEPVRPSELAPVSEEIEAVVLRCLAKNPDNRYKDMVETANALRIVAQKRTRDGAVTDLWLKKRSGKFPVKLLVSGLALLLGSAAFLTYIWQSDMVRNEPPPPLEPKEKAKEEVKVYSFQDDPIKTFDVLDTGGSIAVFKSPNGSQQELRINKKLNLKDIDSIKNMLREKAIKIIEFNLSDVEAPLLAPLVNEDIRNLKLKQNVMTRELFEQIGRMRALEVLNLNYASGIKAGDFKRLKNLKKLINLSIGHAIFPSEVVDEIAQTLPNLNFLDLSFSLGVDGNVASLAKLKRLRVLTLTETKSDDRLAAVLPKLKDLKFLSISQNIGITGKTLASLRGQQLANLAIGSTSIRQADLQYLKGMNARAIDVSNLGLDDAAISDLMWPDLRRLGIANNKMTDKALSQLSTLKALQLVHCPGNPLMTESGRQKLSQVAECSVQANESDVFTMTP